MSKKQKLKYQKMREQLKEATKILLQISNLQVISSMKDKIAATDIYIKPEIGQFTIVSFEKGKEIIKKGEDATQPFLEQLKNLSKKQNSLFVKPNLKQTDSLTVDRITINDQKNYTRAYVIGQLGFKEGSKISYNDLKQGINKLNATENFSTIGFHINVLENGQEIALNLKENENKTFLKLKKGKKDGK